MNCPRATTTTHIFHFSFPRSHTFKRESTGRERKHAEMWVGGWRRQALYFRDLHRGCASNFSPVRTAQLSQSSEFNVLCAAFINDSNLLRFSFLPIILFFSLRLHFDGGKMWIEFASEYCFGLRNYHKLSWKSMKECIDDDARENVCTCMCVWKSDRERRRDEGTLKLSRVPVTTSTWKGGQNIALAISRKTFFSLLPALVCFERSNKHRRILFSF